MNEEELDMNELIRDFNEYSTDYNKTTCEYYENYLKNYQKEKLQLQNNWNELKKWLEVTIKQYDEIGLKFKKQGNFDCASRSYDYLKQYQAMLFKMQELEQGKDE